MVKRKKTYIQVFGRLLQSSCWRQWNYWHTASVDVLPVKSHWGYKQELGSFSHAHPHNWKKIKTHPKGVPCVSNKGKGVKQPDSAKNVEYCYIHWSVSNCTTQNHSKTCLVSTYVHCSKVKLWNEKLY
jgi:hypothetical protein